MMARRTLLRRRPAAAAILAATLTTAARADGPAAPAPAATRPAPAAALFALASVPPAPLPTPAELARRWTAFRHADQATAGFNAVSLPFHYVDPDHLGDPAEADAFAFLLSGDLDWSPGCYCARHAYFVFKTDAAAVAATVADGDEYHPAAVARLVSRWRATAAVGGSITRSAGGYAGVLAICDRAGRVVHRRAFPTPQSFFGLLGDCSAEALAFFGPPPSPALVRFLHERRCADGSIRPLGAAAHLRRGSPDDLDAFANILDHDPGFAEVRYWVGNQAGWAGLSEVERTHQYALSLDARVSPEGLRTMRPNLLPPDLRSHVLQWESAVAALAGPDTPGLIITRIGDATRERSVMSAADRAGALATAARYPNKYYLLEDLSGALCTGPMAHDLDVAAGVGLAALASGEMTGDGSKAAAATAVDYAAKGLGWPGDGLAVLLQSGGFTPDLANRLLRGYWLAGQYRSVVETRTAMLARRFPVAAQYQVEAATAAAIVGRADVVDAVRQEQEAGKVAVLCLPLVRALADHLAGRRVDVDDLSQVADTFAPDTWQRWN